MPVEIPSQPKAPHSFQQPTMGASETENVPVVDSVVRAIQTLTTDANYKLVSDVFTEVMFLKDQNRSLKTAKRELLEEYRSFRNELEDQDKKLRGEKEVLEKKVEEQDRKIAEFDNTRSQLAEAKDSLETQVQDRDKELATLRDALDGLEADKASLQANITDKEAEIAQLTEAKELLESQLEDKDKELTTLRETVDGLESDKTSLQAKVADRDAEIAELNNTKSALTEEIAELNDAKSALAEEKAALESTVEEKTKELATLGEEKEALEATCAKKTKEVEELNEERANLLDKISTLETTVTEKDADLEALREEKATLIEEKDALEGKLSQKEKAFDDLQEVKAGLDSDLAQVKEARAQLEAELTEANAKIEEQTKQAGADADEIAALKADVEKYMAELDGVKEELSKMTDTADEHKARGDALDSELKDKTTESGERASRIEELEGQVADLTHKVEEATVRIEELEGELEARTKLADERADRIQTLEGELEDMTATANDVKARVEFLETELGVVTGKAEQLQTDLTAASEDLRGKNERLAELDGYRVSLRSESEDTYVQVLDTIWTSIAGLVETQFRQDLDRSVLEDESCWANLRQSEYLKNARQIPLPQSNSPAAKQMRVAAVLAVLSRSLHRYIFRPAYLADNYEGDECLVGILRTIACENPTREEHTRATLLALLPEKQKAAAGKRVAAVVREVSWSVQHLLSALQYEAFCTGLETACKLACVQWMRIQVAQMKIEPYFGPPYDNWDWQVLPLPVFGSGEEDVHLHGDGDDQDGAALDDNDDVVVEIGRPVEDLPLTPRKGGGVDDDRKSHTSSPRTVMGCEMDDGEVGPDDIMLVVWPSMCALENGELESITQGLVISKDQVGAAMEEVRGRARGSQRPSSRRARALSMPGRGVTGSSRSFSSRDGDRARDG